MEMPSARRATALGAAAWLFATVRSSGDAFVTMPGQQQQDTATLRGTSIKAAAAVTTADIPAATFGTGTATAGACGLAAVLGLAWKRRSLIQREWRYGFNKGRKAPQGRYDQGTLVLDWQVDPKFPVPGSHEMLKTMVGKDVEVGDGEAWDPFGLSKLYDRNFDFNNVMVWPHVQWLREAEIKHGRVCMIAFIGMVVQQWWQIPGYPQEPDWTKALDLCYQDPIARLGVGQISIFAMLVEGRWAGIDSWIGQMDREPGDLGFDPLKITRAPGFDLETKQLRELKNGRLAMIGCASMAANHAIPGSVPFLTGAF